MSVIITPTSFHLAKSNLAASAAAAEKNAQRAKRFRFFDGDGGATVERRSEESWNGHQAGAVSRRSVLFTAGRSDISRYSRAMRVKML